MKWQRIKLGQLKKKKLHHQTYKTSLSAPQSEPTYSDIGEVVLFTGASRTGKASILRRLAREYQESSGKDEMAEKPYVCVSAKSRAHEGRFSLEAFYADGRCQTAVPPGYDRFDGLSDVVRVLEATRQFEAAEAKTHMDDLARELKHEQLVAIAKEEMLSLERRKREAQFMTSSAPRRKMKKSALFGELKKPMMNFDEQDD